MAKLTPTQIRTVLNDIQTKTAALIEELQNREEALQKKIDENLVDSIINSRLPEIEDGNAFLDHPLKREIILVTHTVDGQELQPPFDSAKRLLQIDVVIQSTQQNIQSSTEENETLTLRQQALTTEIADLDQQLIALGVTAESAARIIPLIQQRQTAQAEEIDDLLIQLADLGVTTDLADQIALLNQAKEEKQYFQNQTNSQIESIQTYLTEEHEKIELLQRIKVQYKEDRQLLLNQIMNVETFRKKLEKENDEVLGIDNTLSLETANKKLTDIHIATSGLINPISSEIIDKDEIADNLKAIQNKRASLLSDLVKDAEDEEATKDAYNDFQHQIATLSGKKGGVINDAKPAPADPADVERFLKKLKTQRQYSHEGKTIFLRSDGSLQAGDNSPTTMKMVIDAKVLLTKEKNQQRQKNGQPAQPIDLYFNRYEDSGSEEAHIIGMRHALAHGVDHAEIIDPETKEAKNWNKIFDAYFDIKPDPNNKKLFSKEVESKYTHLIRRLDLESEVESKDLIQEILSALEPEQISKVLEDLWISSHNVDSPHRIHDAMLLEKTLKLLPAVVKERWPNDIKKIFMGLNNENQAKLLENCVRQSSYHLLSWFTSQKVKIPQYIATFAQEISRPDLAKIVAALEQDDVKNALLKKLETTQNELIDVAIRARTAPAA